MITNYQVIAKALSQKGDRYIFGYEVSPNNPNPTAFDCSELIQWIGAQLDIDPTIPDGAYYQWKHCRDRGFGISVQEGIDTPGALLFIGDGSGVGRNAITHVAISLGNGTTIEARGTAWGVGTWTSKGRFTWAARIPGVNYDPPKEGFKPGDHNPGVKFLQGMTNILRPESKLVLDSKYGPATQNAVKAVQHQFNALFAMSGSPTRINEDGIAGPKTLNLYAWWVPKVLAEKR